MQTCSQSPRADSARQYKRPRFRGTQLVDDQSLCIRGSDCWPAAAALVRHDNVARAVRRDALPLCVRMNIDPFGGEVHGDERGQEAEVLWMVSPLLSVSVSLSGMRRVRQLEVALWKEVATRDSHCMEMCVE